MTTTYTKSLATDFGGNLKSYQFHQEIVDDGTITTTLEGINTGGDVIDIIFAAALSGAEITRLNSLISAHTPDMIVYNTSLVFTPDPVQTGESTYQRVGVYNYQGTRHSKPILKVTASGYPEHGTVDTWNVRVYDATNNLTIAEGAFAGTNNVEELQDLGAISNLPLEPALLELQFKKMGGNTTKKATITSVTIFM